MDYVIMKKTYDSGLLFWNNNYGWTELSEATVFTEEETEHLNLPMGNNVQWVTKDQAIAERLNYLKEEG